MLNIDYANVEACAKVVAENADLTLGVKVRITDSVVGQNGLEPLRRAIRAAEMAGKQFRVMCHIGSAPGNLSDLLDLLRPGDMLTHAYSGAGNNTVQSGRVLPAALRGQAARRHHRRRARRRQLRLHGLRAGACSRASAPDTISSDIHAVSINTPGLSDAALGDVEVPRDGHAARGGRGPGHLEPGRIIGKVPGLGTLAVGAPADLAIFDLVDGPVEFVDTRNNRRAGDPEAGAGPDRAGRPALRAAAAACPLPLLRGLGYQGALGLVLSFLGLILPAPRYPRPVVREWRNWQTRWT